MTGRTLLAEMSAVTRPRAGTNSSAGTTDSNNSNSNNSHHRNSSAGIESDRRTAAGGGNSSTTLATIGPPPSRIGSPHGDPNELPPPIKKPLASTSGGGAALAVSLAEPIIFLSGYEPQEYNNERPAMLRGSLLIRLSKPAKIKTISLTFRGRARTEWPEGIPPKKNEFYEEHELINHTWPFFNAQFPMSEHSHGADSARIVNPVGSSGSHGGGGASAMAGMITKTASFGKSSASDVGLLSSRSFGKNDGVTTQMRGYRLFHAGEYVYNFETPIPPMLPESLDCPLGSVKYELEAVIERQGAFKPDVKGKMPVEIVRVPGMQNLEGTEPITVTRNWEEQLHYVIVVSGKAFPIGTRIPIYFKLTPLDKVRIHRIRVFVTENIEYWCKNKRVHRYEPQRKIMIMEKNSEANQTNNMLGDLEGMATATPTEFDVFAQLPGCQERGPRRLHFDTTYTNIKVHHWIKIVLRLSRYDPDNPDKRRHFEISIDSPIHILSCRCTQNNLLLPAYGSRTNPNQSRMPCPCTEPELRTPDVSTMTMSDPLALAGAALNNSNSNNAYSTPTGRPARLTRNPTVNPPNFDMAMVSSPPPLMTPPPPYEETIGQRVNTNGPRPRNAHEPDQNAGYFASLSLDGDAGAEGGRLTGNEVEYHDDDLEVGRRRLRSGSLASAGSQASTGGDIGLIGTAGLLHTPEPLTPGAAAAARRSAAAPRAMMEDMQLWHQALMNRRLQNSQAGGAVTGGGAPSANASPTPTRSAEFVLRSPPVRTGVNG